MGRHYDIDSLGEHGWPQRIPVKSVRFRGTPRLTSFTMSKETADARSGAVFVRVTARVRTKGIGVTDVFVETGDAAEGPSGGELRRVAGGPKRGTWAGRLRVHHWSTNGGARRPLTVHVFDAALNHGGHFDASALRRMGFPDHLRIINLPDVDQPTVVLRSLQPRVLDLRSSPGPPLRVGTCPGRDLGSSRREAEDAQHDPGRGHPVVPSHPDVWHGPGWSLGRLLHARRPVRARSWKV